MNSEMTETKKSLESNVLQKSVTSQAVIMCILGMAYYYYEYYLRISPSVMSAELKQTFMLNDAAFGHLAACYYYAYTPMQIPVGLMMDRFGPRKLLTLACLICAVSTYVFANTEHLLIAQIARFLIGFGSAFAYVGVLKITNMSLPPKYFAFMAGLCSSLGMLGGLTGQVTMAYMVNAIGWQSTLYYAFMIGLFLTVLLWIFLKDRKQKAEIRAKKSLSNDIEITFMGLINLVKNPQIWLVGLIGCFMFLPVSAFAELWAVNFLVNAGFEKQTAAWGSSMIFLGFAVGGPVWGAISDKINSRRLPLILGAFISAAIISWIIWLPSTDQFIMFTGLFAVGLFSGSEILVFAIGNDVSDSKVSATAVSFINMFTMVGGAFLPPIIGRLLDKAVLSSGDQLPTIHDYSIALTAIPVGLCLAGICSIILKETYHKLKR